MEREAPGAGKVRVLVPVGREPGGHHTTDAVRTRRRPGAVTIGMLDNHKHNTDKVLDRLQRHLDQRHEGLRFVRMRKPEAGKGAPQAVLEDLARECDAVVNGIAD